MKKIILLILIMLTAAFGTIVALAEASDITINKTEDANNKRLTVSGRTAEGAEMGISIHVKNESGETVYYDAVKSRENGEFSFGVDAAYFADGQYYVSVSDEENTASFDFSVPFNVADNEPIKASVSSGIILINGEGSIDSEFSRAYVGLSNITVSKGKISKDNYEIKGLPEECDVTVTAVSERELVLDFSGEIKDMLNDKDIEILLKSSIIYSGSANTDSAEIKGIKIYNSEKSTRVWLGDSNNFSVKMKNETQAPGNTIELELMFRKMNVDNVLEYGKDYTFSKEKLPDGINLILTANKSANKLLISFSGSAKQRVSNDIIIDDLIIKANCAEGSIADSRPVSVTITKANSSFEGGGVMGGGGKTTEPAVNTPNTWNGAHTVDSEKKTYFNDAVSHWAENAINKLASASIINGYDDNTFRPDNSITRAEFVTMTVKALKLNTNNTYNSSFKDVYVDSWYAKQIQCGLDNGFISPDEYFRPNDNIKRSEAMKILIGAYLINHDKVNVIINTDSFSDSSDIPEWSKESIEQGLSMGIVKGYDDASFKPSKNLTRAEAATILSKIIDVL